MDKRVVIASDHAGYKMKSDVINYISDGCFVIDHGAHSNDPINYPQVVVSFANIIKGMLLDPSIATYGLLICGTGIGMSIAANRYPFIRAALCNTPELAILSRKHNEANVLCLGARIIDIKSALKIVTSFLETEFDGGRHHERVKQLSSLGYE